MAAVKDKVAGYRIVFVRLTNESLDGASDSLDCDSDIKHVCLVGAT